MSVAGGAIAATKALTPKQERQAELQAGQFSQGPNDPRQPEHKERER